VTGKRSLIAGVNALFRAVESRRRDAILVDPWAARLVEQSARVQAIRYGRFVVPGLRGAIDELQTAHCVRHRAIDELVGRATAEGFLQIVTLGAGYDMRPARFGARAPSARWLEVDHPATQARKRGLLAGSEERPPERIAADFHEVSLARALEGTGFRRGEDTCFVAEGLFHYLSVDRLERLFADAAALAPRARFIFSFIETSMYERATPAFIALVKAMREIPLLHFEPATLAGICGRSGFPVLSRWNAAEQVESFAQRARGRRLKLSQDVAVADRA
jgi:methyltransferase (TIGR00027 family)